MPLSAFDQNFNAGLQAALDYHEEVIKRCDKAYSTISSTPLDGDYKCQDALNALSETSYMHRMISNDLLRLRKLSPEEIAQRQADEDRED